MCVQCPSKGFRRFQVSKVCVECRRQSFCSFTSWIASTGYLGKNEGSVVSSALHGLAALCCHFAFVWRLLLKKSDCCTIASHCSCAPPALPLWFKSASACSSARRQLAPAIACLCRNAALPLWCAIAQLTTRYCAHPRVVARTRCESSKKGCSKVFAELLRDAFEPRGRFSNEIHANGFCDV